MFVWPLIALAGILTAVWFFGARTPISIDGEATARRLVREAYPDVVPGEVAIDVNGAGALVADASDTEVILLFAMGTQVASRALSATALRDVTWRDAGDGRQHVTLHLHDSGCPRLGFTLAASEARRWAPRLEAFAPPVHAPVA